MITFSLNDTVMPEPAGGAACMSEQLVQFIEPALHRFANTT
jgi:hypothetical protein